MVKRWGWMEFGRLFFTFVFWPRARVSSPYWAQWKLNALLELCQYAESVWLVVLLCCAHSRPLIHQVSSFELCQAYSKPHKKTSFVFPRAFRVWKIYHSPLPWTCINHAFQSVEAPNDAYPQLKKSKLAHSPCLVYFLVLHHSCSFM